MSPSVRVGTYLLLLTLLCGCAPTLVSFVMPAQVRAGYAFVVQVAGQESSSNSGAGLVGCVLQVPNGFLIDDQGPGLRDDPALLARFAPEPGHYLVSLSGSVATPEASTHFVVRSPTAPGNHTFKVLLAAHNGASYSSTSPSGITNFGQITQPSHIRTIDVQTAPVGDFAVAPASLASTRTAGCALADMDGDGRIDLLTGAGPRVLLARGAGAWLDVSPPSTSTPSDAIAAGDFDGDGHRDFVDAARNVYFGDSQFHWTMQTLQPPTNHPIIGLATGDFDGDGRDDIVECDAGGWMRCWQARPGRTFASRSYGLPAWGTASTYLYVTDLDGDGFADIAASGGVWRGNGAGTWSELTNLLLGASLLRVADLDGDDIPELIVRTQNSIEAIRRTGLGTHVRSGPIVPLSWGATLGDAAVIDFDRDGLRDLVIATDGIHLWRNPGSLPFVPVSSSNLPPRLSGTTSVSVGQIAVGDFGDDLFLDLVVCPGFRSDWNLLIFENVQGGVAPFGQSCVVTGLPSPTLGALGNPTIGNATFAVQLAQGTPFGLGLVWFGTSHRFHQGQPVLPLPLDPWGAPGCTVFAEPLAWQLHLLDSGGSATAPLAIPNAPALHLLTLYAQGAAHVPPANPLGVLTSNGLVLRIP